MKEFFSLREIDQAADAIRSRSQYSPKVGLILGSGLGALAEAVEKPDLIPFHELPHFVSSTVEGHIGKMVLGMLENACIMVLQGRTHFYEGYSMAEVTFPVRVMQRIGITHLVVTNAAGAINPEYAPGDVMLITDQLNLIGMAGLNPLRGPNLADIGPRFPDMSQVYDRALMELARVAAKKHSITLREGVYACLAGPSFETPADLRFLRLAGADAVGMSTVPEVIIARHGNMRVLGLSGISNKANLDGNTVTTHEEVLGAGKIIVPKLTVILREVLRKL
jgi:purine-nucleoside phosphorylase